MLHVSLNADRAGCSGVARIFQQGGGGGGQSEGAKQLSRGGCGR